MSGFCFIKFSRGGGWKKIGRELFVEVVLWAHKFIILFCFCIFLESSIKKLWGFLFVCFLVTEERATSPEV